MKLPKLKQVPVKAPGFVRSAINFSKAVGRAVHANKLIVSEEVYRYRTKVCSECEFWDAKAWNGIGRCKHPDCGCTRIKAHISTEFCPIGKWLSVENLNQK